MQDDASQIWLLCLLTDPSSLQTGKSLVTKSWWQAPPQASANPAQWAGLWTAFVWPEAVKTVNRALLSKKNSQPMYAMRFCDKSAHIFQMFATYCSISHNMFHFCSLRRCAAAPCLQAAWPTPSVRLPAAVPTSPVAGNWAEYMCSACSVTSVLGCIIWRFYNNGH